MTCQLDISHHDMCFRLPVLKNGLAFVRDDRLEKIESCRKMFDVFGSQNRAGPPGYAHKWNWHHFANIYIIMEYEIWWWWNWIANSKYWVCSQVGRWHMGTHITAQRYNSKEDRTSWVYFSGHYAAQPGDGFKVLRKSKAVYGLFHTYKYTYGFRGNPASFLAPSCNSIIWTLDMFPSF